MKREDITKIFEGATDEQINAVLDINSSDIGKAKQKLEVERDSYKTQLETAQTALKEFEGVDVGELKGKECFTCKHGRCKSDGKGGFTMYCKHPQNTRETNYKYATECLGDIKISSKNIDKRD